MDVQQDQDSFQFNPINSGVDTEIQYVCYNKECSRSDFNTHTGSKVVTISDWTEVERLSAPLYILSICIEHSQQVSAKIHKMGHFTHAVLEALRC